MKFRKKRLSAKRREFGLGGAIGGILGKAAGSLIPIPGVGTAIGGVAGKFLGDKVEGLFTGGRKGGGTAVAGVPNTASGCDIYSTQGSLGNVNMRRGGLILEAFRNGGDIDPEEIARRVKESARLERERLNDLYSKGRISELKFGEGLRRLKDSIAFVEKRAKAAPKGETSSAAGYFTNRAADVIKTEGTRNLAVPKRKRKKGGALSIGQDAIEFVGPKHETGGIPLPGLNAEVEGGETIDFFMKGGKLKKKDGGEMPYVFSATIKVPGSNLTFADHHKALVKKGASEGEIMRLAAQQEKISGRKGGAIDDGVEKDLGGFLSGIGSGIGKGVDYAKNNVFTDENLKKAGEAGKTLLPYLPSALAVGKSLFGSRDVPQVTPTRISRQGLRDLDRMPTTVDVSPQLARASASYRSVLANPNISSNAALAAHAQNLQTEGDILGEKRNRESELLSKRALQRSNLNTEIGVREAAAQDRANQYNTESQMMADAARDDMLIGGLQGLANTFAGQQRDKALEARDQQLMDMQPLQLAASLAHMTPETRRYYLKVLKDYAPEKYREVFDKLSQDPEVPEVGTPGINGTPRGTNVPVYGGQGYSMPANVG